jgi:hypothetical protein
VITLEAIKALSWQDNPSVSEGEESDKSRYRITVEVHPDRHIGQRFYAIRRGYGKFSIARTPERALHDVRQRRGLGKR